MDTKEKIKVEWRDIKEWTNILEITHGLMCKKFTPHFRGYEDDLMQEMMISLIKAIRRIKKGEITSEQNYIITTLKYTAYKIAKKLIAYDNATSYFEDFNLDKYAEHKLEWIDLFSNGVLNYNLILSVFESFEEQYMVLILMEKSGYSRYKLRDILKVEYQYISKLEHRVKEKLLEIIKMYTT